MVKAKSQKKKEKEGTQKREKVNADIDSGVLDQTRLRPHFTGLRNT
jgi:hypothetical protein